MFCQLMTNVYVRKKYLRFFLLTPFSDISNRLLKGNAKCNCDLGIW